jgi:hypothetical protein
MSEFERTKRDVEGHSILITSWYDDGSANWRASAPTYAYLNLLTPTNPVACPSRQEAVEHVCALIANFLGGQQEPCKP